MILETKDLILKKAAFEDWKAIYHNVWSRPETARYMAWRVTENEREAQERMKRTIKYQENHDTYLVYEKKSGQAIGFAGVEEIRPRIYQDASIALGPEYVGLGYGKQILKRLLAYCSSLGGEEFYYSTRSGNEASRALAIACGFRYQYSEHKVDGRNGEQYELEVYQRKINSERSSLIFRVAVLQMRSQSGKKTANTQTVIAKMEEAAEAGADILLLPECFITGYNLPVNDQEVLREEDRYMTEIRNVAEESGIGVVATAFTQGKVQPQNSAFVIDKKGHILMKYSKVHTCDFADEACLESGDEFMVCDFDGVRLGVMICYDREYPESARVLMLKGAEIILVPNDCYGMRPRIQALSTRAYENMVGIAMANPDGRNAGCSCAYSPICWDGQGECVDNTLLLADEQTEGLYYADFDMDKIRCYREHEMMGNTFRKCKAYGELLKEEIHYPFIRQGQ